MRAAWQQNDGQYVRVWQKFLAIGAVAELARVQRGGDRLNSGEFSYRQELLPHLTVFSILGRRLLGRSFDFHGRTVG
jgi:hypothetical protein